MANGLLYRGSRCDSTTQEVAAQSGIHKSDLIQILVGLSEKTVNYYDLPKKDREYFYAVFELLNKQVRISFFFSFYARLLCLPYFPVLNATSLFNLYKIWIAVHEDELFKVISSYDKHQMPYTFWNCLFLSFSKYYFSMSGFLVILKKIDLPLYILLPAKIHVKSLMSALFSIQIPENCNTLCTTFADLEDYITETLGITGTWIDKFNQYCAGINNVNDEKQQKIILDNMTDLKNILNPLFDHSITLSAETSSFFTSITGLFNITQICKFGIYRLHRLSSFYYSNKDIVTHTIEAICNNFTGNDFPIDPALDLFLMIFKRFDVCPVLEKNFYTLNEKENIWLLHVLHGNNLCSAEALPLPINKKAAHLLMSYNALFGTSISQTFLYAQLCAMGADYNMALAILRSEIGRQMDQFNFWNETIFFFINNKINHLEISTFVDFINYKKQQNENYSMKGRTVNGMYREMALWHVQLGTFNFQNNMFVKWQRNNIKDFELLTDTGRYIITQLLTSKSLFEEGQAQHHCVFTYTRNCVTGISSIFSLRFIDINKLMTRMLTIEVSNNRIVQIKGKFNRNPNETERAIVSKWAKEQGVRML